MGWNLRRQQTTGVRMPFVVTYLTADPWPSSLPGVAA